MIALIIILAAQLSLFFTVSVKFRKGSAMIVEGSAWFMIFLFLIIAMTIIGFSFGGAQYFEKIDPVDQDYSPLAAKHGLTFYFFIGTF